MAFESLSDKLQNVFKGLRGKGRLSEDDVKSALKEVKLALLEADVNYKVAKDFVNKVSFTVCSFIKSHPTLAIIKFGYFEDKYPHSKPE